jgi:branched-chain amino acid aminotransferase
MTAPEPFVVMIDGLIVSPDRAVLSVFDRGFLYGDSVYEVMRTYDGVVFALREHMERLFRSARQVFIDIPVSEEQLTSEVLQVAAALPGPSLSVRVHVTRGEGPLGHDFAAVHDPKRVIIAVPMHPPSDEDYRRGIAVALFRTQRTVDNTPAAGAKVANYLVSLLALREAHATGAKEAIIVDGRGRVLEGATSNVFVVRGGELVTPPESEGILSGITRSYLLRAAASIGISVRETSLTRGDLVDADEVFLSSTSREVLPVTTVDGSLIAAGQVGPVTRSIHRAFRKLGGLPPMLPGETPG